MSASEFGELVVGVNGFVGSRLRQLTGAEGTSRRNPTLLPDDHYLDLLYFKEEDLPPAKVVYLCAGINGTKTCDCDPVTSYRVNVDATVRLAQHYRQTAFLVWISSTTVEWSTSAYARHKAQAESILRTMSGVGIVRAGRVLQSNLDDLCNKMMDIGRHRKEGVFLWNENEQPYAK